MKGDRVKCFLIEEIDLERVEVDIREGDKCPARKGGAHFAVNRLAEGAIDANRNLIHFDQRELWPAACACGFAFTDKAYRCGSYPRLHRRVDNGAIFTLDDAPAGAIWRSSHYETQWGPDYKGPDGKSYCVKLPDGHTWLIDSRANNCTSPCKSCGQTYGAHHDRKKTKACEQFVDSRPHKCWVRAGVAPALSVTKGKPGESCKAGAGSILTSKYHGHLRNGELIEC